MKPQLNDAEAERMLEEGKYIWSDARTGYVRARRKGQSVADYRAVEPDVVTIEELSDHGLTDAYSRLEERTRALEWLAERIRQGSGTRFR